MRLRVRCASVVVPVVFTSSESPERAFQLRPVLALIQRGPKSNRAIERPTVAHPAIETCGLNGANTNMATASIAWQDDWVGESLIQGVKAFTCNC